MANNISSANVGFGRIPTRPISRVDLNAFSTSLNTIDTKSRQALEKKGAIETALAQLELNPEEDRFKQAYIQSIKDQIDAYAKYGSYDGALNIASELVGSSLSDPMLLGRVRAQASYKQFTDNINKRTDIDQDTKDWALATNPYSYNDKYDNNGNVIGGTEWKPTNTPVATPRLDEALQMVKQMVVTRHTGGTGVAKFVAADGSLTDDYSKGVYGLAYQTNGKTSYIKESEARAIFESVAKSIPNFMAGLQQDYDVALWKYNKMTPEEQENNIDSYITTDNKLLSPQEYLEKRIGPFMGAISGVVSKENNVSYGDGIAKMYASMMNGSKKSNNSSGSNLSTLDPYYDQHEGMSKMLKTSTQKAIGNTYGNLMATWGRLQELFPRASKAIRFDNVINYGNYQGAVDYLKSKINSNNPNASEARKLLNLFSDQASSFNGYLKNASKDERDAFTFTAAVESGAPLPKGNKYTRDYNKKINKIFDNNKISTIGYTPYTDDQFEQLASVLGIKNSNNINEWKVKGFTISNDEGKRQILFDRNNKYLVKLADAINKTESFWNYINPFRHGGFIRYNNHGEVIDDSNGGFQSLGQTELPGIDILYPNTPAYEAKEKSDEFLKGSNKQFRYDTAPTYAQTALRDGYLLQKVNGEITDQDYDNAMKIVDVNEKQTLINSITNGYNIYGENSANDPYLHELDYNEKNNIRETLMQAYADDPKRIHMSRTINPSTGIASVRIMVYPKVDSKSAKVKIEPIEYVVEGLEGSQAAIKWQNSSKTRAEYNMVQGRINPGYQQTLYNGMKIKNVTNDSADLYSSDNRLISQDYNLAKTMLAEHYDVENLKELVRNGEADALVVKTACEEIIKDRGGLPGTPQYQAAVTMLIHDILTDL